MKNLKIAFFMRRNKHTESLEPLIIKTLARFIFFPDGKNLLEKWESEIEESMAIKHMNEVASLENSSYMWSCTTFGNKKFQLSGHFKPSIDPSTSESIGSETGNSAFILTKIDSEGKKTEEVIPYGTKSLIDTYRYSIPLPNKFADSKNLNLLNSSISVTEGHESSFLSNNTFHNLYTECKNGILFIYVKHYKGLDGVDLSELPYITADLNIFIDGLFN